MTSLLNNGIIELNPAPLGPRAVTLVTGLGRSGTSMAAWVLDASGVPMGERKDDVVFEDHEFYVAISSQNKDMFLTAYYDRRMSRPRWGFKATGLHDHAWTFDDLLDVRMVVMVRDPVAVTCRAAIADRQHPLENIDMFAASAYRSVLWATRQRCPVLLCSYEKAIAKPRAFVERLVTFAGGNTYDLDGLAALVQPERAHYVENARVVS